MDGLFSAANCQFHGQVGEILCSFGQLKWRNLIYKLYVRFLCK